jgi:hypothetical protein
MRKPGRRPNNTGRSTGAERHVRLYYWLLKSCAYRTLTPASRALLIELYALYNGANNGQLFLSVRDGAQRINVAPNTVVKAFRQLEANGFIRPAVKGGFTCKHRHATTWVLSEFEYAGALPTKDFMRLTSEPKIKTRCHTDVPLVSAGKSPLTSIGAEIPPHVSVSDTCEGILPSPMVSGIATQIVYQGGAA